MRASLPAARTAVSAPALAANALWPGRRTPSPASATIDQTDQAGQAIPAPRIGLCHAWRGAARRGGAVLRCRSDPGHLRLLLKTILQSICRPMTSPDWCASAAWMCKARQRIRRQEWQWRRHRQSPPALSRCPCRRAGDVLHGIRSSGRRPLGDSIGMRGGIERRAPS